MTPWRLLAVWANFFALLLFTALPVPAAQSAQGTLEVRLKDHRNAIGDFAKLDIMIDSIAISPKAGLRVWQTGWKDLKPSPETVDLTRYVGKKTITVFRGPIDAGAFNGFHLKLKRIDGVLKKTKKTAPVKNAVGPVQLAFDVRAKGETILVIDLTVMDLSDHPPRGYELEIKGYELITDGRLIRKVPPA